MPDADSVPQTPKGGRNLIILGCGAILISLITTGISLWVYRQNDIYLDRSRPGFISEGETDDEESIEKFSEDGEIDASVLNQYLSEFDYVKGKIDGYSSAFSGSALSDDSLSILHEETEPLSPEYAP